MVRRWWARWDMTMVMVGHARTEREARVFGNPVMADPFAPELATQVGVILADGMDGEFQFEIDWIDACP